MHSIHRSRHVAAVLLAAGWAFVGLAGVAAASHNEPKVARKFVSDLVRTYPICSVPNNQTPNQMIPACSPAAPVDGVCGIEPLRGKGKVRLVVDPAGDIRIKVNVTHLTGCDGETLNFSAWLRATTDNCIFGGECTSVNFQTLAGSCLVANGRCKINTTSNFEVPGSILAGNNLGLELISCGLTRTTGLGAPLSTLSCGLLVK